jgi:hypothetical protein
MRSLFQLFMAWGLVLVGPLTLKTRHHSRQPWAARSPKIPDHLQSWTNAAAAAITETLRPGPGEEHPKAALACSVRRGLRRSASRAAPSRSGVPLRPVAASSRPVDAG